MASVTPAGGDGRGDVSGGDLPRLGLDGSGGYSSSEYCSEDEDFAEPALSMEQRLQLARIWVANPSTAHHWTHGFGGAL